MKLLFTFIIGIILTSLGFLSSPFVELFYATLFVSGFMAGLGIFLITISISMFFIDRGYYF